MKDKAAEFITPEEQAKHKRAVGADGETAACELLGKKGYEIAARNYRAGRGEIDIIARSSRHIVFVEVKTRSSESFGAPRDAVTRAKQARYGKIALWYAQRARLENCFIRFDVAEVRDGAVSILENAFFL